MGADRFVGQRRRQGYTRPDLRSRRGRRVHTALSTLSVISVAALLPALTPSPAGAQGMWDAELMIDPFPSPYVSDWEANPHIASFTVFNNTSTDGSVRLIFSLTDQGGAVLANGSSDPITLPPGPSVFDSPFQLSGSFDYDVDIQDMIVRTGRLPEGDYTACTAVTDRGGFVLAEACWPFSIVYPDPPMLLTPFDGDRITEPDPFFEWTPLQVPFDYPVQFVLQIAKILPGQTPHQALSSGIPHHQDPDLISTHLQYPLGALPFEPGARYAWRVQAIDQNGYPASANDGWSEIWTFAYVEGGESAATVRITPSADTLAFPGDTARLVARAYDEYDFELPEDGFEWASADTGVVRVDSAGVITGVAEGETQIIARLDEVADTVSIATSAGGSGLRITFFDPETEKPELYTLLESGSYEEIADALIERLQSGQFELPLPGVGGLASAGTSSGYAGGPYPAGRHPVGSIGSARAHGPSEPAASGMAAPAAAVCPSLTLPFYVHRNDDEKSIAIGMRPPADVAASLYSCLGLSDWRADRPGQKLELLFMATIPESGAVQASLGLKLPFVGLFEDQPGIRLNYAVLVLNFWREFEMDAAKLHPAASEVREFYPHKFKIAGLDVERKIEFGEETEVESKTTGIGAVTFYGRLDLSNTPIVDLLDVLGYQDHAIELQADLSLSRNGELLALAQQAAEGQDAAQGGTKFHIEGRLPRRVPQVGNISEYIHWAQVGIQLEVETEWERAGGSSDTTGGASGTGGSGAGGSGTGGSGTSKTTVTPKLTHTMELQLPFQNWPPLTLKGAMAWADVEKSATSGGADTTGTGTGTTGSDTARTSARSDTTSDHRSKWILSYQVAAGGDTTLVLWDFLHVKLGAEIAYARSTSSAPAEWELKLSGGAGFGSAEEAATVTVAYARESANCGGPNEPPCQTPQDTETGQPQPVELSEKQGAGQWKLMLESKGLAFGALFRDLRRLIEALR